MLRQLRDILKTKSWWYKISDTELYLKIKNPTRFRSKQNELKFYQSVIGINNNIIFDVGAHIGDKSVIFSQLANKIILFEPGLRQLKMLKARFNNNSNMVINNCAIGAKQDNIEYYEINNDTAYSSLSTKHINEVVKQRKIINELTDLTSHKVQTNTLSYFINKYGRPDYIKIDTEGYEKEVINGLDKVIPIISFEANLPQFIPETLEIINYLDTLSKGTYLFNYSVENKLELSRYVKGQVLKRLLMNAKYKSVEVFCKT